MSRKIIAILAITLSCTLAFSGCSWPWSNSNGNGSVTPDTDVPVIDSTLTEDDITQIFGNSWLNPTEMIVAGDDTFILDTGNSRILLITDQGTSGETLCQSGDNRYLLQEPLAMTVYENNLYIANAGNSEVVVLSTSDKLIKQLPMDKLKDTDEDPEPSGIAITNDGDIWVSDRINNRVLRYSQNGDLIDYIGQGYPGNNDSQYGFNEPMGLYIDSQNSLYVADCLNGRVVKYSDEDRYIQQFMMMEGNPLIHAPKDVVVSADGFVYFSDLSRGMVQVFAPNGELVGRVGYYDATRIDSTSALSEPYGVFLADDDYLYVIDQLRDVVVFYIPPDYWQEKMADMG